MRPETAWTLGLIALLALSGCADGADGPAETTNVTGQGFTEAERQRAESEDRLIETLIELHLVDARAQFQDQESPALRDSVLAKYGFTDSTFQLTMQPYLEQPEAIVALYSTVLDRMGQEVGR